jgi:hypothetical protein
MRQRQQLLRPPLQAPAASSDSGDRLLHGIFWSIALNTVVPVVLYQLSKRFVSPSELTALIFATLFPVGESLWGLAREWQLDPIALVVLLGIAVDAGALVLGGSPKLLLLRESLFTGAFGAACFVSLLMPRPLMFYFGRYFIAGPDPGKRRRFDESWTLAEVRHGNRLVTSIWGIVFVGELVIRVALIDTVAAAWVLVISPLLLGSMTVVTIIWSLAYAHRMRQRVLPRLMGTMGAGSAATSLDPS